MFSASKTKQVANGAFALTKSLRIRSNSSAYLSRTPTTTTNRQTWTFSTWLKLTTYTNFNTLFCANLYTNATESCSLRMWNGGLSFETFTNNSYLGYYLRCSSVFRDPSAWYHIVLSVDTTQALDSNRFKIYVNGQAIAISDATYPPQNWNSPVNSNSWAAGLGAWINGTYGIDGYVSEVNFIDGQQLTPSSFGAIDLVTGVWTPIKYTGTYGTNGFHLPFTNSASTTTLGYDTSGNGNHFTTNNISLTAGPTYDSMNDVPMLTSTTASNYCVMNSNATGPAVVSDGNLYVSRTSGVGASSGTTMATMGVSSGKWYWEVYVNSGTNGGSLGIGIVPSDYNYATGWVGDSTASTGYWGNGAVYGNGTGAATAYATGDTIGVTLDMDARTVRFYKNNVAATGTITGVTGNIIMPALCIYDPVTASLVTNFGQQPFTYTPPSGYVALNTYNLPTPAIIKGSSYMNAVTYTGNGNATAQSITGVGFKPDFVWLKGRSAAYEHILSDSNRGAGKILYSSLTNAEPATIANFVSFDTDGFTVNANGGASSFNASGSTYISWNWRGNQGTNVTNNSGTITSTLSLNASSGFSVVTYTGIGVDATVGHGLGVTPSLVIVKSRTSSSNWNVWFTGYGADGYLVLNSTGAKGTYGGNWGSGTFNSSVFSVAGGTWNGYSGYNYVAYCFAPVAGFSAFGTFVGNGSSIGPFVYLGFRPKYLMIKKVNNTSDWLITDGARDPYNYVNHELDAEVGVAEGSGFNFFNYLSNGFQCTQSNAAWNTNGDTYIYIAFAENPFKYANAR